MEDSSTIEPLPEEMIFEIFDKFDLRVRFVFREVSKKYARTYPIPRRPLTPQDSYDLLQCICSFWGPEAALHYS